MEIKRKYPEIATRGKKKGKRERGKKGKEGEVKKKYRIGDEYTAQLTWITNRGG